MKTSHLSEKEASDSRKWVLVDAEGQTVGRLASKVANLLRGKDSPRFSPYQDCGDFVVVINADKVVFTGKKWEGKIYYHHTGYVGGIVKETAGEIREKKPEKIISKAVWGMIPKGPLGRKQFKKLRVYAGSDHTHAGQQPVECQL